ncbi:hypothetical protein H4R24_000300 [Coemansia sp. RSA 988]|nr:hypothetical protein H4R24_000300 [Coemansia sp. RSA 988]
MPSYTMFPSLGLLSQIDCPHRDRCQRGTLCLFAHDRCRSRKPSMTEKPRPSLLDSTEIWLEQPDAETQIEKPKSALKVSSDALPHKGDVESEDASARQALERALAEFRPPVKCEVPEEAPRMQEALMPLVENEPAKNSEPVDDWRERTLNYDRSGPAYDPATESRVVQPQLKAMVGEKVGYAKRQRALETLFKHLVVIHAADSPETPWLPAMQAVQSEAEVYGNSVAGTYHGKLLTRIRELKQQAAKVSSALVLQ